MKSVTINQAIIDEFGKNLNIVFTPLHGTGEMLGRKTLAQAGFEKIAVVEEQAIPDGDFPTLKSPNPESQAAFELSEKLGREVDADMRESGDLIRSGQRVLFNAIRKAMNDENANEASVARAMTDAIKPFFYRELEREPIIIPMVLTPDKK